MCIFLILVLPGKTKLKKISDILDKNKITLTKRDINESVPVLKANDICYDAATPFRKMCDCDTSLGHKRRKKKGSKEEIEQWSNFLKEILKEEDIYRVGLILFWEGKEPVGQKAVTSINELDVEKLEQLEVNVLYEFIK